MITNRVSTVILKRRSIGTKQQQSLAVRMGNIAAVPVTPTDSVFRRTTLKLSGGFFTPRGTSLPDFPVHSMRSESAIGTVEERHEITARQFNGFEKLQNKGLQLPSATLLILAAWGKEHPKILKQQLVGIEKRQSKDMQMPNKILECVTCVDLASHGII